MAEHDVTPIKTEAAAPAATVAKKAEKIAEKVTEKVTETAKTTTEAATSTLKSAQEQVKSSLNKAAEMAREAVATQRSALETVVEAGKIYGQGLQGLATHAAEVNKVQFEDTLAHLRALTSVKSVKEAVELQTKFARATASRALTETSAFVEDYLKVTEKALAPVTTKVREAAEKVKSAV